MGLPYEAKLPSRLNVKVVKQHSDLNSIKYTLGFGYLSLWDKIEIVLMCVAYLER